MKTDAIQKNYRKESVIIGVFRVEIFESVRDKTSSISIA